jgi:hypothetical protein
MQVMDVTDLKVKEEARRKKERKKERGCLMLDVSHIPLSPSPRLYSGRSLIMRR